MRLEFDPLGQWHVAAVVDRIGLAAHVGLPGVGAAFAPAAGLLLATERAADLRTAGADVHVGDAAIATGRAQEALRISRMSVVIIEEERPCFTLFWMAMAFAMSPL
jgi:hypothetical protein